MKVLEVVSLRNAGVGNELEQVAKDCPVVV